MDGNYNKLLEARVTAPAPEFQFFINRVIETIRNEIATSAEKAYSSLTLASACELLRLPGVQDLQHFIQEFNSRVDSNVEWVVSDSRLTFRRKHENKATEIPKWQLMSQALNYAIELERIV
jgi:26S proteasome regulatory subunit N12